MSEPAWMREFRRAVGMLNHVLVKAREAHPDANYYLAMDSLHILSGPSHEDAGTRMRARQDRSLVHARIPYAAGGDW